MNMTRPDIYSKVHRGLRMALFELGHAFGQTDLRNDDEVASLQAKAAEVIHFLVEHGHKEDLFILPLLESKAPGAAAHDQESHVEIERRIEELRDAFGRLGSVEAAARVTEGTKLYFEYNRFLADYLVHMDEEEQQTTAMLYEHCTDEELRGAEGAIIASIPPADLGLMLRYMLPSIDGTTRSEWLRGIKQSAPAPAFEGVMGVARQTLAPDAFAKLEADVA